MPFIPDKPEQSNGFGQNVQDASVATGHGITSVLHAVGAGLLPDLFGQMMNIPTLAAAKTRQAFGDPQGAAQIASQPNPFQRPEDIEALSTPGGALKRAGEDVAGAASWMIPGVGESKIASMTAPTLAQRAAIRTAAGAPQGVAYELSQGETDPKKLGLAAVLSSALNVSIPEAISFITGKHAGKAASEIGRIADDTTDGGRKARAARAVIQPDIAGDSVGTLGKEERVAKDVLDSTKGHTKYSLAKELESTYDDVNKKLATIITDRTKAVGPIPLTGPNGEPEILDEVMRSFNDTPIKENHPELIDKAKNYLERLLTSGSDTIDGKMVHTTDLGKMNTTRLELNKALMKWYQQGSPMVSQDDVFNGILAEASKNLSEEIAHGAPMAQEYINMQARIIPSYKGLYENLVPRANPIGMGKFALGTQVANAVLDPLRTLTARQSGSPYAMRAAELLDKPVQSAVMNPALQNIINALSLKGVLGQPQTQQPEGVPQGSFRPDQQ